MTSKHIERAWLDYRSQVLPANASATQIIETRRGFYAGAWSLYTLLMCGLTSDPDSTATDLRMVESIAAELRYFNENVKAGAA